MGIPGSPLFFYEGRTVRGLRLVGWALGLQCAAVTATGATLAVLAILLGPVLLDPVGLFTVFVGIVGAICAIELAQVGTAVLFLVGFMDLRSGRHEYGWAHVRSVGRATLCLLAFAVIALASAAVTFGVNLIFPAAPGVPLAGFLTWNLILAPVAALLAGAALVFLGRSIAEPGPSRRLMEATALGVLGAVAGPLLLAFSTSGNPGDLSATVNGLLAFAVAGDGLCALSLLIFVFAFRRIRRDLMAGTPAPALPPYAAMRTTAGAVQPTPSNSPGPSEPPKP